jgi:hypothetical protein
MNRDLKIHAGDQSRNILLGLCVFLGAVICALLMAEIGLRVFTQFPVSYRSNRIADPDFGYRLSPRLADVDENGFRNSSSADSFDVLAVGDSNTFGVNVSSEHAWPAELASETGLKVYNTGVGSYGIATYHAILSKLLASDKSSRAIVALFPANDFQVEFSFCDIDFESPFWKDQRRRLRLNLMSLKPLCNGEDNVNKGWYKWIKANFAITSAIDILIFNPLKAAKRSIAIPGGLPNIVMNRTNPTSEELQGEKELLRESAKMLADWATTFEGRIAIVIIPSKEHVFYEIMRDRNVLSSAPTYLVTAVGREIANEEFAIAEATRNLIPIVSALPELKDLVSHSADAYPTYDGHPYEAGYVAFSQAAQRALAKLKVKQ